MPDSRVETYQHIAHVRGFLNRVAADLIARGHRHDNSKLRPPEVEAFDEAAGTLKDLEYDSPGYKEALARLGPALKHHYAHNDHHPEHHRGGVHDMDLIQMTEMLCDWMAAVKRMEHGDIFQSIHINAERFGYGPEIQQLLHNTARNLQA